MITETHNNRLEHFIDDGGQNPLVIVDAEVRVDLSQSIRLWSEDDAKCDVHILKV